MPETKVDIYKRLLIIIELILVFLFYNYALRLEARVLLIALAGFIICLFLLNLFIFKSRILEGGIFEARNWRVALLMTLLGIAMFGFLSFFREKDFRWLTPALSIFFVFIFSGFYITTIKHQTILSQFTSIALIFFTSYNVLSSKIIFPVSSLKLAIIFLAISALVGYLNLSLWGFKKLSLGEISFIALPIFLEFFIVLEFIPIAILGRSLLAALNYYIFSGLIYLEALPVLDKKLLRTYITITAVSLVLILLAAEWR